MRNRILKKQLENAVKYGTGITKTGIRKWYNPLRYIKSKIYQKNISLKNVLKIY